MTKFLRLVLGGQDPLFTRGLRQLERASGNHGDDLAYMASVVERAHRSMRRIGLDPSDTTARELYQALQAHADNESLFARHHDVALLVGNDVISFNPYDVRQNLTREYAERTHEQARAHMYAQLEAQYAARLGQQQAAVLMKETGAAPGVAPKPTTTKTPKQTEAPYILCIGDIFTDVFIELLESEARIDTDKDGSERLSLPFGTKPPYKEATPVHSVGPSPNAAVACARLGMRVGLMSWLGNDQVGKDSLNYLSREQIDTAPMIIDKSLLSNTYYVLRYGADRTILVKNEAYTYKWRKPPTKPDWIYLSLLSGTSWTLHEELTTYLEKNPEIKFAFQPGTFHFKWGAQKLKRIYARAEIVVMNREEAVDVTGKSYDDLAALAQALHDLGPKYVVITDGSHGSYASHAGRMVSIPNYPDPAPPLDRTGAGDAFASTIVAAMALGHSFEDALLWAPINSMSVVQKLGAQAGLLGQRAIKKFQAEAPKKYHIKELS